MDAWWVCTSLCVEWVGDGDDLGMKEYARAFYLSPAWQNCRNTYAQSVGGLCERCLRKGLYVPGEIVHHKTHITPDNITDENVTLNWENLELVCRDCHGDAHRRIARRYKVGADGKIFFA